MEMPHREEMVTKRVNIGLADKTHTQAKLISILKGTTLNEYLRIAVEEAIKKDKDLIRKMGD